MQYRHPTVQNLRFFNADSNRQNSRNSTIILFFINFAKDFYRYSTRHFFRNDTKDFSRILPCYSQHSYLGFLHGSYQVYFHRFYQEWIQKLYQNFTRHFSRKSTRDLFRNPTKDYSRISPRNPPKVPPGIPQQLHRKSFQSHNQVFLYEEFVLNCTKNTFINFTINTSRNSTRDSDFVICLEIIPGIPQ